MSNRSFSRFMKLFCSQIFILHHKILSKFYFKIKEDTFEKHVNQFQIESYHQITQARK